MPKLIVTSSSNISILDTNLVTDLCAGVFLIDLKPSTFIGVGANNALGAKVRITNPYGVAIKDYSTDYDIPAPFDGVFSFNISTNSGNYEYGEFIIDVQVTDADNKTYTVTKKVKPCYPDIENKNRKYGSLGATIKGVCRENKVYVSVDSLPTYNGLLSSSVIQSFDFDYPTGSSLPKATRTLSYFSDYLFEGVYKLEGEICATYNDDDNISYRVNYKVSAKKEVLCQIDECAVFNSFDSLWKKLDGDCNEQERIETGNKVLEAVFNFLTARSANDCGEDASAYIKRLQEVLGCKCTCDFGEAPISNSTPAKDVVIDGCNVTAENNGLTVHYTINNYSYVIDVVENGGFVSISAPQLSGCEYKQSLTFDVAKVYDQMKVYANSTMDEANFWASVINKTLTSATPPAGYTPEQWASMSLIQRIQALIDRMEYINGHANQVNADWNATTGFAQILNKPTIPVYTSDNAVTAVGNNFQWGGALTHDTSVTGGAKVGFLNGRVGIGMMPVFPLDIFLNDNGYNLAAQITSLLVLQNGRSRIGLLSSMQIFGGSFTATSVDQVSGKTGQLTFYNTGAHVLNAGASYAGNVGILIGYATGSVTGSVISALAAISNFGKTGNYDEAAGLRINTPVGNSFIDADPFSGTINDFYYIVMEAFNPVSWSGTITRRWGLYQKGTDPHRFGGKIVWDATLNAGSGNVTINKPAGTFTIPAGQLSATVTNSMVTTNSMVWVQLGSVVVAGDSTPSAPSATVVAIEANGSFTVFLSSVQTVPMKIKFIVYN